MAGTSETDDPTLELAGSTMPSGPTPPRDTWAHLALFREEMDHAKDLVGQLQATLRAARAECKADAAFWYSGPRAQSVLIEAADELGLNKTWCQDLARGMLASTVPDAPAFVAVGDEAPLPSVVPRPTTAAFVRLRPARMGWLLVAALRPAAAFGPETLGVLRYLVRCLAHQQQFVAATHGLRTSLTGVFKSLVALVDGRDAYTTGHGERVARIARRLGEELDLKPALINDLYLGGLIHDIGTLGVPDDVLHCPTKLTTEQMMAMRRHVLIGDELLASARHVERLRPAVRNHHERWDGKGYPDALAGDAIPMVARVIAVADACDALMSARRYRPPISPPQIEAVLRRFADSQWDPEVVAAFLRCANDIFPPIYQKGVGDSAYHALSDVITADIERSTIFHPALDEATIQASRRS